MGISGYAVVALDGPWFVSIGSGWCRGFGNELDRFMGELVCLDWP